MQLTEIKRSDSDNVAAAPALPAEVRANRFDILSRLADDLAHEIKQPLHSAGIMLELIRTYVRKGEPERALERADIVEQELRRVHDLINPLLQLLRPEKPFNGPVAVDGVLDTFVGAIEVQAKLAKVTFDYESEGSLYAQIDPEPFKFAVLNLLSYAIQAESETGGTITVRGRRAGDEVYLVVTCSRAALGHNDAPVRSCKALLESAGGALESLEPQTGGSGSTVTLVMPPGKFA